MQVAKEHQQESQFHEANVLMKAWLSPELRHYGSISDLTASGSKGSSENADLGTAIYCAVRPNTTFCKSRNRS